MGVNEDSIENSDVADTLIKDFLLGANMSAWLYKDYSDDITYEAVLKEITSGDVSDWVKNNIDLSKYGFCFVCPKNIFNEEDCVAFLKDVENQEYSHVVSEDVDLDVKLDEIVFCCRRDRVWAHRKGVLFG